MTTLAATALLLVAVHVNAAQTDVYRAGEGGYHSYRIPALIVSKKHTTLAWTFDHTQQITNLWNASLTQNPQSVSGTELVAQREHRAGQHS
jgi:hypothetical protein